MTRSSAEANRDLQLDSQERLEAEKLRVRAASAWAEELKEAARELDQARSLRRQIEATKQNGRDDNGERMRELGREHFRLAGTGGGAT